METARIRLVAGLGNPGPEYANTRHNVGYMVLDRLAHEAGLAWESQSKWGALTARLGGTWLLKPTSFMNRSGTPIADVTNFYKIEPEEILVVLDDFALPLGRLRLRPGGGTGGHNGLDSIIVQLGSDSIPRLRIGIGSAPKEGTTDYVLGRFFEEERELVQASLERAVAAVKCAIDKGLLSAMNTFNQAQERE